MKICAKDIKEGDRVSMRLLVTRKETGTSKAGKPYLSLKLRDSSAELEARVWEEAERFAEVFKTGEVVAVKGNAVRYQGRLQLNVVEIGPAGGGSSARDFLPSCDKNPAEMMAELEKTISDIKDRHIRKLLEEVFSDREVKERFAAAPAAKTLHHAYLGGLLEHVVSIVKLGKLVASHYRGINADIVTAGLILHDIGKIYEFSFEGPFDYTDEGRLLGHIAIGLELVENKIKGMPDFPKDLAMLLKHVLLSHHGHLEFGSPRRPKTLEAMVVYYLDDLDAKVSSIQTLREGEGVGKWTEFQRSLERQIYKGIYIAGEGEPALPENEKKTFELFKEG